MYGNGAGSYGRAMNTIKRISIVAALAFALAAAAGSATASSQTVVGLTNCIFVDGGHETVPAGTDVVLRAGWSADTSGQVQSFLQSVTASATVTGRALTDANQYFSPVFYSTVADAWVTVWVYDTSTTLKAGQTVTVQQFQWTLKTPVPGGKDPDSGRPYLQGAGPLFPSPDTCTIKATG